MPWTSRLDCPAPGARRRADLPHRGRRALGRGAGRDRGLRADRGPLLAARVAARSRAPKSGQRRRDAGHVFAALARSPEPDRDGARDARQARRGGASCEGSRLPRRDAARRPQARPLPVHAARPASAGRFRDGVRASQRRSSAPAFRAASVVPLGVDKSGTGSRRDQSAAPIRVAESSGGLITLHDFCARSGRPRGSAAYPSEGNCIAQAAIRTNRLVGVGNRVWRLGNRVGLGIGQR